MTSAPSEPEDQDRVAADKCIGILGRYKRLVAVGQLYGVIAREYGWKMVLSDPRSAGERKQNLRDPSIGAPE